MANFPKKKLNNRLRDKPIDFLQSNLFSPPFIIIKISSGQTWSCSNQLNGTKHTDAQQLCIGGSFESRAIVIRRGRTAKHRLANGTLIHVAMDTFIASPVTHTQHNMYIAASNILTY